MSRVNGLMRRRMGLVEGVDDVTDGGVQQGAIEMRVVDGPVLVDEDGVEDVVEEAVVVDRSDGLRLRDYEEFMSRCDARIARANLLQGRNVLLLADAEARGRRLDRGGLSLNEMLHMREEMDEADQKMRDIDEEIIRIGIEQRQDSYNLWRRHRGLKESIFGSSASRMDRDHAGSSDDEDGNGVGGGLAPGSG